MYTGTYTMFDKIIDVTCYKHTRVEDKGLGVWEADGGIITSSEYSSPDGTVYKKVVDIYKKDISIICPDTGIKPSISLSFKAVPGRSVTQCEIRITNLQLDSLRVKEWTLVEITAGYRGAGINYGKTKLSVDVFSAWTESPNPDGVTVIQGIATGGALGMFFGPRKFYIQFNVESLSIRELVTRLLNQKDVISFPTFHEDIEVPFLNKRVGNVINPDTGLLQPVPGTFGDLKIQMQNIRLSADTGYQIVQWLGRELYEWGKKYGWFITVNILNDRVKITCTNKQTDYEGEDVVELNVIDSAAFTGGTLTVKAPWAPSLIPGGLFSINPKYFSLQNTYRNVSPSVYQDKYSMYRCITMDVSFDTNDNNNQMTLFAIPFSSAQSPWDNYTDASINYLSDEEKANTLSLEQWVQKKQTSSLMTTILFGPSNIQEETVGQNSFWAQVERSSITGVSAKAISMDGLVNNESITAVNWYRTFIDTMLPQGHGYTSDGDENTLKIAYPALTRSEMQKILKVINAERVTISTGMKSKLRMSRTLLLNPDTLWILYPVYAYLQSYNTNGLLSSAMSKNTLGALLDSTFNMFLEATDWSLRKRSSPVTRKTFDTFTVKPADVEKTDVVYIPNLNPSTKMVSVKEGGSRTAWNQLNGFTDVMKVIINDKTMKDNKNSFDWDMFVVWYYYLKEVAQ